MISREKWFVWEPSADQAMDMLRGNATYHACDGVRVGNALIRVAHAIALQPCPPEHAAGGERICVIGVHIEHRCRGGVAYRADLSSQSPIEQVFTTLDHGAECCMSWHS